MENGISGNYTISSRKGGNAVKSVRTDMYHRDWYQQEHFRDFNTQILRSYSSQVVDFVYIT